MHTFRKTVETVLLALLVSGVAHAQDDDLKSGKLEPRTALVSEEVARQKLLTFGLEQVSGFRHTEGRYVASVQYEGRLVEVELDEHSGVLRERGRPLALVPSMKAPAGIVKGYAVKIDRADIARAPLLIEPFVPGRPEVIRPLGDLPVKELPGIPPVKELPRAPLDKGPPNGAGGGEPASR